MEFADFETDDRARDRAARDFPEEYFDPERQSRFAIAVLMVLASPFLVDAPIAAMLRAIREDIFITVLIGVFVAKFGLVAMWLAWGGSRAIWRMLVVMLSLLFTALVITPHPDEYAPQQFMGLLFVTLLSSALIALPKFAGVRWVAAGAALPSADPNVGQRYQYSIVDIMIWTLMCAILAGLIQWIGFPRGIGGAEGFILSGIAVLILSLGVLIAMWAELTAQPEIVGRVAMAYGFAIGLAIVIPGVFRAPAEAIFYITATAVFTISYWLGFFYVLRRLGHRLIKRGASTAAAIATSDQPVGSGA